MPRPSTLIRGYPVELEKHRDEGAREEQAASASARRASSRARSSRCSCGAASSSRRDEVAAYMQSIFGDRIQKREAHLRWAAEVTSTINVDQLLSKPKLGPEFTGNSDVQAQAKPGGRAAGGGNACRADHRTDGRARAAAARPRGRASTRTGDPDDRPRRHEGDGPVAGDRRRGRSRPTWAARAAARAAARRPIATTAVGRDAQQRSTSSRPQQQHQRQQQVERRGRASGRRRRADHPGAAPMVDPLPPMHLGVARNREPMRSEPPTMMQAGDRMPCVAERRPDDDGEPARARSAMIAGLVLRRGDGDRARGGLRRGSGRDDGGEHARRGEPAASAADVPAGRRPRPVARMRRAPSQRRPPPPQPFAQTRWRSDRKCRRC